MWLGIMNYVLNYYIFAEVDVEIKPWIQVLAKRFIMFQLQLLLTGLES